MSLLKGMTSPGLLGFTARSAPSISSVLRVVAMEPTASSATSFIQGQLVVEILSHVLASVSSVRKNNKKNRRIMRTLQTRSLLKAPHGFQT